MSSEDHNLATILEDTKTQKKSIVDAHYIDYYLHVQGLGQENQKTITDKKVSRLTRQHAQDIDPILRRNAEKARRRREEGEDGVPADEAVPPLRELPKNFKPFSDDQQQSPQKVMQPCNHATPNGEVA
eukprot:1408449-Amphidinium_carterae.1